MGHLEVCHRMTFSCFLRGMKNDQALDRSDPRQDFRGRSQSIDLIFETNQHMQAASESAKIRTDKVGSRWDFDLLTAASVYTADMLETWVCSVLWYLFHPSSQQLVRSELCCSTKTAAQPNVEVDFWSIRGEAPCSLIAVSDPNEPVLA